VSNTPMKIDPKTGSWVIDWASSSEEEILKHISASKEQEAEARKILADLLPAAHAQALLTKGAIGAYEALIKLAKRAPEKLVSLLGV
jgi:hypothetical protein